MGKGFRELSRHGGAVDGDHQLHPEASSGPVPRCVQSFSGRVVVWMNPSLHTSLPVLLLPEVEMSGVSVTA
jgi:hypothetical protein